jgi:TetR/AcrR family transcriptional regulator
MPKPLPIRPESAEAVDDTRTLILNAALEIFSRDGAAGARTEEIARAAGVNKALLYYYFKDKNGLLGAVIEHVMSRSFPKLMAVLESNNSPRERLLAYVNMHFDLIASRPQLARLIQYEILRAAEGRESHLALIVEHYNLPLSLRLQKVIRDGIDSGDFREVDPRNTALSIVSTVIFYFMSAPVIALITQQDPFDPTLLAQRKAAVIDFVSHAICRSPERIEKGQDLER